MSIGRIAYQLAYQISPIILTDGIAANVPGGMLPIVALSQSSSFVSGLLAGNVSTSLDEFYAQFSVMPGGTLHSNQIGMYPFANQQVAANAIIAQPLHVPLKMTCHPRTGGAMVSRIMTASALKSSLDNHNFNGGTYTILTPSFMYTGCVMLEMKDISPGNSVHPQVEWQLDFIQPLLSQQQASITYNSLMEKIAGGLHLPNPSWSGLATQVGKYVQGTASNAIKSVESMLPL